VSTGLMTLSLVVAHAPIDGVSQWVGTALVGASAGVPDGRRDNSLCIGQGCG
jgi:hypothetical protein